MIPKSGNRFSEKIMLKRRAYSGSPPCSASVLSETSGRAPMCSITLTEAAKVTEKFRRVNYGNLEIEITVDDPKAYTKPWTVRVNQRILPDAELIEFICEERDAAHYLGGK